MVDFTSPTSHSQTSSWSRNEKSGESNGDNVGNGKAAEKDGRSFFYVQVSWTLN